MNVDYFVFLIYSDAVLIQREVLCCILHRCGEGWVVADRCTVVVRNRSVLQQGLAVYFVAGDVTLCFVNHNFKCFAVCFGCLSGNSDRIIALCYVYFIHVRCTDRWLCFFRSVSKIKFFKCNLITFMSVIIACPRSIFFQCYGKCQCIVRTCCRTYFREVCQCYGSFCLRCDVLLFLAKLTASDHFVIFF